MVLQQIKTICKSKTFHNRALSLKMGILYYIRIHRQISFHVTFLPYIRRPVR